MPVIKSAIKKLRQDKKREKQNDLLRANLKLAVKSAEKSKSGKKVAQAISVVDKAAKNNIIHENKAARIKSSLSKIAKPENTKTEKKTPKSKSSGSASKKTISRKKAVK